MTVEITLRFEDDHEADRFLEAVENYPHPTISVVGESCDIREPPIKEN